MSKEIKKKVEELNPKELNSEELDSEELEESKKELDEEQVKKESKEDNQEKENQEQDNQEEDNQEESDDDNIELYNIIKNQQIQINKINDNYYKLEDEIIELKEEIKKLKKRKKEELDEDSSEEEIKKKKFKKNEEKELKKLKEQELKEQELREQEKELKQIKKQVKKENYYIFYVEKEWNKDLLLREELKKLNPNIDVIVHGDSEGDSKISVMALSMHFKLIKYPPDWYNKNSPTYDEEQEYDPEASKRRYKKMLEERTPTKVFIFQNNSKKKTALIHTLKEMNIPYIIKN